jgi:cytochrome c peroxidase
MYHRVPRLSEQMHLSFNGTDKVTQSGHVIVAHDLRTGRNREVVGVDRPGRAVSASPDGAWIALGERLFFDTRLSADGSLSCASCHQSPRAFTDGHRFGRGVLGRQTTRNVPSILNAGYGRSFFWDGRTATLEEQVLAPITAPEEMGADLESVVERLVADRQYRDGFLRAFDEDVGPATLARALASFVRSRRSGNSALDRHVAGDAAALERVAASPIRISIRRFGRSISPLPSAATSWRSCAR